MRFSVCTLAILAGIISIERPSLAQQNGAWCIYKSGDGYGNPQCRLRDVGAVLGRPARQRWVLFTQPVPLAGRSGQKPGPPSLSTPKRSDQLRDLRAPA